METDVPDLGSTFRHTRTFLPGEVKSFVELTGDQQPRHTERNEHGELMVPGLLTASMITKLGGEMECLAHRMDFEFHRPVFTNEEILCEVSVTERNEEEDRYRLQCSALLKNEEGEAVLKGRFLGFIEKKDER